jgi:hypothetical protein
MIITGVLLGLIILFAICIIFWFMKGSQTELKEAGVHLDPIDPANEPWPFPIAMPQHDRAKKKQVAKKATTVAKKTISKEKAMATKPGLYANIHKKQARIEKQKAEGKPVETMRKPGTKGAPTAKAFKESAKTAKK